MFSRANNIFDFIIFTMLWGALALLGIFAVGFLWFYQSLPEKMQTPFSERAQAIIVFTGSNARVPKALELLRESHAPILFVSGVHRNTESDDIGRSSLDNIVLGRSARNTFENAIETALWVQKANIKKAILITSAIHMPRSKHYLQHFSPNLEIVPLAVQIAKPYRQWWRAALKEYAKYLLSLVHTLFANPTEKFAITS